MGGIRQNVLTVLLVKDSKLNLGFYCKILKQFCTVLYFA